ncbi:hypothetical protein [Streptomyces sp. NPDC050388]|uniref:hypothetical protein n=1 Tax=Streptomyces sp. NPDC050388 TaxID=3155781 RepID=UPI003424C05C
MASHVIFSDVSMVKRAQMETSGHSPAWDAPSTRRSWLMSLVINVIELFGWAGAWVILLGISAHGSDWIFWVLMPYFPYGLYRVVIQIRGFLVILNILRVLREYPWRIYHELARGIDDHPDAENSGIWIGFPDPVGGEGVEIPMTFVKHHRAFWWLRRIGGPRTKPALKAQLEPLWFAGDPRFLGVVAVSSKDGKTPKRLHFLYQPSAYDGRAPRRSWEGADPADLERARRAGARYVDASPPAGSGVKGSEGAET